MFNIKEVPVFGRIAKVVNTGMISAISTLLACMAALALFWALVIFPSFAISLFALAIAITTLGVLAFCFAKGDRARIEKKLRRERSKLGYDE